jgi:hypothetical protein
VVCIAFTACGASTVLASDSASQSLQGLYTVTWTRSVRSCAPQALPLPSSSNTTQYAAIPVGLATYHLAVHLTLTGDTITLIPQSVTGAPVSGLILRGSLSPTDSVFLGWSLTQSEGARIGGHEFFVVQTATDSAQLIPLVETPPAPGLRWN